MKIYFAGVAGIKSRADQWNKMRFNRLISFFNLKEEWSKIWERALNYEFTKIKNQKR